MVLSSLCEGRRHDNTKEMNTMSKSQQSIAMEKAGVMRPFKPCIYAGHTPPSSLFNYARKIKTNLQYSQNDFQVLGLTYFFDQLIQLI